MLKKGKYCNKNIAKVQAKKFENDGSKIVLNKATETTADFVGSKIAHKTMTQKQLISTKHLQNMFQEFWNGKIMS